MSVRPILVLLMLVAPWGMAGAVDPVVHEIDWSGRLHERMCEPQGFNSCRLQDPSVHFIPYDSAAPPTAFDLTATWDFESPVNLRLTLDVYAARPCGPGCFAVRMLDTATGTSPLTVARDGFGLHPHETTLLLHMHGARYTPDPIVMFYQMEQDFHVGGTVTLSG